MQPQRQFGAVPPGLVYPGANYGGYPNPNMPMTCPFPPSPTGMNSPGGFRSGSPHARPPVDTLTAAGNAGAPMRIPPPGVSGHLSNPNINQALNAIGAPLGGAGGAHLHPFSNGGGAALCYQMGARCWDTLGAPGTRSRSCELRQPDATCDPFLGAGVMPPYPAAFPGFTDMSNNYASTGNIARNVNADALCAQLLPNSSFFGPPYSFNYRSNPNISSQMASLPDGRGGAGSSNPLSPDSSSPIAQMTTPPNQFAGAPAGAPCVSGVSLQLPPGNASNSFADLCGAPVRRQMPLGPQQSLPPGLPSRPVPFPPCATYAAMSAGAGPVQGAMGGHPGCGGGGGGMDSMDAVAGAYLATGSGPPSVGSASDRVQMCVPLSQAQAQAQAHAMGNVNVRKTSLNGPSAPLHVQVPVCSPECPFPACNSHSIRLLLLCSLFCTECCVL